MEFLHRSLEDRPVPTEFLTDGLFNGPAPTSSATFTAAGILLAVSLVMWVFRVKKAIARAGGNLEGIDLIRALIACAADNDDPLYTIISFTGISVLFLAGIQVDYPNTIIGMLTYYFFASFAESLQILLAYWKYDSITDLKLVTIMDRTLEDTIKTLKAKKTLVKTTVVQPNNVYEDMGREKTVVIIVFLTQLALIFFVSLDIYLADAVACFDGTLDCPVGMLFGSYGLYFMGIMQSCVYMLGPKSDFGQQSEQNPAFWIVLLIASKQKDAKILWEDDAKKTKYGLPLRGDDGKFILDDDSTIQYFHNRYFASDDAIMWRRFFMSYLINGVGFHVLVHTLPMQVAASSSLIGLVYRFVGMLYLVDLDDTAGYTLFITHKDNTNMNKPLKIVEESVKSSDSSGPSKYMKEAYKAKTEAIISSAEEKLRVLQKVGPSDAGISTMQA